MSKNEKSMKMDNTNTVVIYDNREAKAGKLLTGGSYQYIQTFTRNADNTWNVRYSTSSEIDYCPICGVFTECNNCMDYDKRNHMCTKSVRKISTEELMEEINKAMSTENMSVDIF